MTDLVLVHGRAQQDKGAVALKAEWVESLRRGLALTGLELPVAESVIRFPYFGDALRDMTESRSHIAEIVVRGEGLGAEEAAFLQSVIEEVRLAAGVTDAQVAAETEEPDVVERGPLNWLWVRAVLRALDKHVPGTSGPSIALFTRDVHRYLRNVGIRDRIEAGVRAALRPGVPAVVVGHSLGSVVTYNLLRREGEREGWMVPLFVTVGSPLAVGAIRRSLAPLRHPACAMHWFNAMDPRDLIALHPLDEAHFPVDPQVENKTDIYNATGNRHGITGYLSDPEVVRRIHAGLTAET